MLRYSQLHTQLTPISPCAARTSRSLGTHAYTDLLTLHTSTRTCQALSSPLTQWKATRQGPFESAPQWQLHTLKSTARQSTATACVTGAASLPSEPPRTLVTLDQIQPVSKPSLNENFPESSRCTLISSLKGDARIWSTSARASRLLPAPN